MNLGNKYLIGCLLGLCLVTATVVPVVIYFNERNNFAIDTDPIIIWEDSDFEAYGFPGEGTAVLPYIIENFTITTKYTTGISIINTTKHFVIQNCIIDAHEIGIRIENTSNSTVKIIKNICIFSLKIGIYIRNSPSSELVENHVFSNSENGIYIEESPKSILNSNICSDNGLTGIRIINSPTTAILENICLKNADGIVIENSNDSLIKYNLCKRNYGQLTYRYPMTGILTIEGYGIGVFNSNNTIVDSNNCNDIFPMSEFSTLWGFVMLMFGILIFDSVNNSISNNTCYNNEMSGINLEYSSGIAYNNTCSSNALGISTGAFWDFTSDSNFTLLNNTCSNNELVGIKTGSNSTLLNNICSNNGWAGVETYPNSTLINNKINNNGFILFGDSIEDYLTYTIEDNWVNGKKLGFYVNLLNPIFSDPTYGQLILINCTDAIVSHQDLSTAAIGMNLLWCPNSTLFSNICNNNHQYGILTDSSSTLLNNTCNNNFHSGISAGPNSTLHNNTCNYNWEGYGILADSNSTLINNTCNNNHIGISASPNSTLLNNTCSSNRLRGIILSNADYCVIAFNLLVENSEYGIYVSSMSNNNTIHHNNFVDNNNGGGSQALDNGANNIWYDESTMEGNYYSDYSGVGPYSIDGSAGSEDLYPFLSPIPLSLIYIDAAIRNSYKLNFQILIPKIISISRCFEISSSLDIRFKYCFNLQFYIKTELSSYLICKKVIV
jgi:parallel beta-helix repeat protein